MLMARSNRRRKLTRRRSFSWIADGLEKKRQGLASARTSLHRSTNTWSEASLKDRISPLSAVGIRELRIGESCCLLSLFDSPLRERVDHRTRNALARHRESVREEWKIESRPSGRFSRT